MIYRIAAGIAALLLLAWGSLAAASAIYCYGRGMMPLLTFPYLQWIDAARWWNYSNSVTLWVAVGGIVPTLPLVLVVFLLLRLQWQRRQQDLYGKTGWATSADMQRGGIERAKKL